MNILGAYVLVVVFLVGLLTCMAGAIALLAWAAEVQRKARQEDRRS